MKKFLMASALLVFLAAASCKRTEKNVSFNCTVLSNTEKQSVFLDLIELEGEPITMDTAIAEMGKAVFVLKGGAVDPEALYRVRFEKTQAYFLVIPDNSSINVTADLKSPDLFSTNSNGSNSFRLLLAGFNERLQEIDSIRNAIVAKGDMMDSSRVVLETGFREKITAAGSFLLNYADTTETPAVAIYALGMSRNLVSPDQVKPALNAIAKRFPKSKKIAKLAGDVNNQTEPKQTEDLVGKEAPLFEMPDVNGRTISLASLRGKYVLVDFWASWCKPCRMENPNVVAAYQQFKDKNFTVLGVSLDKNKEAWLNAIKEDGLAWTHVSDLKQWQSSVVPLYQIEGIPFNVLLDPQGKVIAKGLRGEDLLTQLAAILK